MMTKSRIEHVGWSLSSTLQDTTTTVEIFPWNDRFNTDIPEIDTQHRQLVDLLNTLVSHLTFHSDLPALESILDELKRYALFHFRSEETIWLGVLGDDSWCTGHGESHSRFIAEVLEIESRGDQSTQEEIAKKLSRFLTHWLALHIIEDDIRMSKVFHGVRAGYSLEQAKQRADEQMNDGTRAMVGVVMTMYDFLADRTLQLLSEINCRRDAERRLIEANTELQAKASIIGDRTAQLDAMFNLSPDGFVAFSKEGMIKFVNPAFLVMTGIREDEILGRDESALSAALIRRCSSPSSYQGIETLMSNGNGQPAVGKIILSIPHQVILQMVGIISDSISVSKILYFRDATHESTIDQMKSEFLTTAAHELRNPMASIYGFAEVLMTQDIDSSTRKEIVGIIYSQSEQMVSILNELLDLARIESKRGRDFDLQTLPVQKLVEDAIHNYHIPPHRSAPTVKYPDDLIYIRVDREKFCQAIINILSNAYKYSPGGGEVEIAIEHEDFPSSVEHFSLPTVSISITDHGIGMSAAQAARVGERFYRADKTGSIPGSGLGISIVKEIVELLAGQISISSKPDCGTTVVLSFPLASESIRCHVCTG